MSDIAERARETAKFSNTLHQDWSRELVECANEVEALRARAEKAEAERDAAQAQVAPLRSRNAPHLRAVK